MHANLLLEARTRSTSSRTYLDPNYDWVVPMARLRPGVSATQAQAALAGPFSEWARTAEPEAPGGGRSHSGCQGRLGRTRRPAAEIFEAAVYPADAGGTDPQHRLREYRQSAAGARGGPEARNRTPAELGGWTVSDHPPTPHRERSAGRAGRRAGCRVRHLGNSFPDAAAGEWTRELHVARGIELARAGRGGRALAVDGRAVRACSGAPVDADGLHAGAQGIADRRSARARVSPLEA